MNSGTIYNGRSHESTSRFGSRQQIITLMLLNLRSVSHLNEGVQ